MDESVSGHLFVGSVERVDSCAGEMSEFAILPKLIVMVILEGSQHFIIDDEAFRVDAAAGPVGFAVNIARPSLLRFRGNSPTPLSKVQISAPEPWLRWQSSFLTVRGTMLDRFTKEHLAQAQFTPTKQIVDLTRRLMRPPAAMRGEMRQFYRQSRGIDILCATFLLLSGQEDGRSKPKLASQRRGCQVRDYILAHLDEPLTLEDISRGTGASVSSAQRLFKSQFGVTISEFIRSQRLGRAREALETRGVTIAEAAHIAGYTDSAHFSAAFKRDYGVPPSFHRR